MNVQQLIEELQKLPQDTQVIMSRDSEGNGYSSYSGYYSIGTIEKSEVGKSYIDTFHSSEDECNDDERVNAIILWPMN